MLYFASETRAARSLASALPPLAASHSCALSLGSDGRHSLRRFALQTWEATNGEVNPKQFRNNVKALVPDASADESTALFESLDADGGGTLDTEEIKEALALLREASVEADKEATRLKKASVSLWKAAKAAQAENKKVRRADQLEAIKQAEAAAAGAARAEADAEAARMAKEAKAAAAKRAKEDEKAEFEAKLQARRQANAAGTDP